jgi:hypothetical protein
MDPRLHGDDEGCDNDNLTIFVHYVCAMNLKPLIRSLFALGAVIALPLALSACASSGEDVVADNPPPPVEVEAIPVINDPMYEIWRPGYWSVGDGGGFVWISGKVISRPAPTAVWASAHWVRHVFGWTFQDGHWE